MNEQELRQLLTVSVEDVLPSQPATAGWDRARRTRRTRRAVGAVALAVALIGGGTVAALRPPADPPPDQSVAPTVAPTHADPVQRPPAELTFPPDPLARLGGPATVRLSERPVQRALAMYQPMDEEYRADGPVRVLGDDGVVRSLDVVTLAPTRDADGNEAPALKPGVLSPDGRWAAFAQTNELVMVDLTTAGVRRVPLTGYLELVVWANDRVLVGGDNRTYAVDRDDDTAGTIDVSAGNVVAPDPAAGREAALVEMVGERGEPDGCAPEPPARPRSAPSSGSPSTRCPRRTRSTSSTVGAGCTASGWPAQRGSPTTRSTAPRGWPCWTPAPAPWPTCSIWAGTAPRAAARCWAGAAEGTVLFRLEPAAVARWNPETGEITGVVRDLPGVVVLAG